MVGAVQPNEMAVVEVSIASMSCPTDSMYRHNLNKQQASMCP